MSVTAEAADPEVYSLMQQRRLCRETAKGRSNGVELDLLDLEIVAILVDHVVGSEQTECKVLSDNGQHNSHGPGGKQTPYLNIALLLYPKMDVPEVTNELIAASNPATHTVRGRREKNPGVGGGPTLAQDRRGTPRPD